MERFKGVATKYLQQYWNWYPTESASVYIDQLSIECFGQRNLLLYREIISRW
jgi:hypothetical protein